MPSTKARPRKIAGKKKTAKEAAPTKKATSPGCPSCNGKPSKSATGKPSTKGTAIKRSKGNAVIDPNQKNLPIVEDERIPAIERAIKQYAEKKSQRSKLKEDIDSITSSLPPLFKKHELNNYSASGYTVSVTHGADEVKFKKAKSQ